MVSLGVHDKKRGVTYPDHYSNELAELFGIYAGDGCLSVYRRGTAVEYRFVVSGNIEDRTYLEQVNSLVKKLFHLSSPIHIGRYKERRWAYVTYRSKCIVTYFEENGFSPRRKEHISVPEWITNDDVFVLYFLKGLFDTDGHLAIVIKGRFNAYPIFSFQLKPKEIIADCGRLFRSLGFKINVFFDRSEKDSRNGKVYIKNHIFINGWKNFLLWKEIIGSNNPKIWGN